MLSVNVMQCYTFHNGVFKSGLVDIVTATARSAYRTLAGPMLTNQSNR